MSTLSQFSGGGIKSIQRGTITIGLTASTAVAATITAVNTAKTILNYCGCTSGLKTSSSAMSEMARIELSSSTQITATSRTGSMTNNVVVSYEVIEYF